MKRILFICHGNICRSPMAEFVLKDMVFKKGLASNFEIASAATSREEIGNDTHRGTKGILKIHGIPFEKRCAVQVTAADYAYYDHLILMDRNNLKNLQRIIPADPDGKISLLLSYVGESGDIADPWYTDDFELTYKDVVRGCEGLLKTLGF